jgi:hypothetical protein
MPNRTNKPLHDESIIEAHEDILNNLLLQGNERNKRLTSVEQQLIRKEKEDKDNSTLLFDTLGIKLKDNGERKKQIAHALDRIKRIETREEYKEHKEETIFAMVYEIRDKVSKFEGYLEGLSDGEEKVERKIVKKENALNIFYNKYQTWLNAFVLIVAILTILYMAFR